MLFIFAITDTMYAAQADIFVLFNVYVIIVLSPSKKNKK